MMSSKEQPKCAKVSGLSDKSSQNPVPRREAVSPGMRYNRFSRLNVLDSTGVVAYVNPHLDAA